MNQQRMRVAERWVSALLLVVLVITLGVAMVNLRNQQIPPEGSVCVIIDSGGLACRVGESR